MPINDELIEVYENGAMPNIYPIDDPEREGRIDWWCKMTDAIIDLDIVVNLARIGMIDSLREKTMLLNNPIGFDELLNACREHVRDWKRKDGQT